MSNKTMKFTAILADDETSILKGLEDSLNWQEMGIDLVCLAHNGEDALNAIIKYNPNLAIIDIRMPKMTGLEVIKKVRNLELKTDFIILSGYDYFSYAKEAIRFGAKAYLLKPIDKKELQNEIYQICIEHSKQSKKPSNVIYKRKLHWAFFNKLIDSDILDSDIVTHTIRNMEINLSNSSCYVCVLLYQDNQDENISQDNFPYDKIIQSLEKEFVNEKHIFWKYNSQQIIGIINTSNITPFQTATKCLNIINDNNLPLPLIGIGDTVSNLIECSYSYNRSLTALNYQLYNNTSKIFSYEIICSVPPKYNISDIDYLPLVQRIVKKDFDNIRDICNKFIDGLLYVPMPPPNYVLSNSYALFNIIEQEFSYFLDYKIDNISSGEELYLCKSLSEIREWLSNSFCYLAEFIDAIYGYSTTNLTGERNSIKQSNDTIIQKAKEFVQENITNNIKNENIAQHVNLSPSYFSNYFKNKTGVNLGDYLMAEKMLYSRVALLKSEASINEISNDIGYVDYRSFSRAFKNYHGLTPSEFQLKHNIKTFIYED